MLFARCSFAWLGGSSMLMVCFVFSLPSTQLAGLGDTVAVEKAVNVSAAYGACRGVVQSSLLLGPCAVCCGAELN